MMKAANDRSERFFRRQLILSVRDRPDDWVDDPYLAEALCAEAEGIFLWCLEGLRQLLTNCYRFTVSARTQANRESAVRDNNVVEFMASFGYPTPDGCQDHLPDTLRHLLAVVYRQYLLAIIDQKFQQLSIPA